MSKRFNNNTDYIPNMNIYCPINKYGYKLNINHKDIKPLYERYKQWKGVAFNSPLSDEQRIEFESYIEKRIKQQ